MGLETLYGSGAVISAVPCRARLTRSCIYGMSYYGIPNFLQAFCPVKNAFTVGFLISACGCRRRIIWRARQAFTWSAGKRNTFNHFQIVAGQPGVFQGWTKVAQLADAQVLQDLCARADLGINA